MSKVTVKRFLNKRVKPVTVYDDTEKGYYLYYTITYNRKTQNIKSLLGAVMTEKAYETLEKNESILHHEINYNVISSSNLDIKNELFFIQKAVEYIVNDTKINDIFSDSFTPTLKSYFESLEDSLFSIGWRNYKQNIFYNKNSDRKREYTVKELLDKKYILTEDEVRINELYSKFGNDKNYYLELFYYSFNKEKNLLQNLLIIKNVTGFDLSEFIFENTLKIWYVIDLISRCHKRDIKINFLLNYNESKYIALNKKIKYTITDEEIEIVSKYLKDNTLIL